jgi:hypothetical protein
VFGSFVLACFQKETKGEIVMKTTRESVAYNMLHRSEHREKGESEEHKFTSREARSSWRSASRSASSSMTPNRYHTWHATATVLSASVASAYTCENSVVNGRAAAHSASRPPYSSWDCRR